MQSVCKWKFMYLCRVHAYEYLYRVGDPNDFANH